MSVGSELLCIGVMWRGISNKNKIMTMLLVTSAADILSLAAILLRFHLQDHMVMGTPCLVGAWLNYFGTIITALVHMQITFNRFVAVVYSMKVQAWCTWKKNVGALSIFTCFGLIVSVVTCIPRFLGGIYMSSCDTIFRKFDTYALVTSLVYYIGFICVPVLLIVVWSVWIIIELIRISRKRRALSANLQDLPRARINLGLLASVALFLVFILPVSVIEAVTSFGVSVMMTNIATLETILYLRCSAGCLNMGARLVFVEEFRTRFIDISKVVGRKVSNCNN